MPHSVTKFTPFLNQTYFFVIYLRNYFNSYKIKNDPCILIHVPENGASIFPQIQSFGDMSPKVGDTRNKFLNTVTICKYCM